nr:hypothetical protein [Tanacetum cinerariifolium]
MSNNDDRDHTNSPMITKLELKIGDEFLKILHDNSFNGIDGSDVIDHIAKELDKNTKSGLWDFYVNEQTKGAIDDLDEYNEPCEQNSKTTCSDLFFKTYLDAQDGKDIYKLIERDYSPIPIPAHRDISNLDELCKTEEFTVVRYSMGSCEEFSTVEFIIVTIKPVSVSQAENLPFPLELEDNKVPVILGRHMLATALARIDVFGREISLEVGMERVVFNANKGKTSLLVCVINDFQVLEEFEETKRLEEFLMNDDINEDLGDFLEENDL